MSSWVNYVGSNGPRKRAPSCMVNISSHSLKPHPGMQSYSVEVMLPLTDRHGNKY